MAGTAAAASATAHAATVAVAAPAEERLKLDYAVYVGGFSAMQGAVSLRLAPDRYTVGLAAETQGMIDFMLSWRTNAASSGDRRGAAMTPAEHRSENMWRGEPRSVVVRYDETRIAAAQTAPDHLDDDREQVPPDLTRATLDPLSAFVAVMEGLRRGESCTRVTAAFDGRRRFDMHFQDLGAQPLPPGGYSSFAGAAVKCRVRYVPVAGYKRKQERNVFWRGPGGERPPIDVWFAPTFPGGPPAPVRMETETPLGQVVAHLVRAAAE